MAEDIVVSTDQDGGPDPTGTPAGRRVGRWVTGITVAVVVTLVAVVLWNAGDPITSATRTNSSSTPTPISYVLVWWPDDTFGPDLRAWSKILGDYQAAHPAVRVVEVPGQYDPVTSTGLGKPGITEQSSLFQQWGGSAEVTQVRSGRVMDLTGAVSAWVGELGPAAENWQVDGRWYGIPYDYHATGFWYRKDLFKRAGITAPPTTMDDLDSDVRRLKGAGIAPIALDGKDASAAVLYWEYLVLRECPRTTVTESLGSRRLSDPCFVRAGQDLRTLLTISPFQKSTQPTPAESSADSPAGLLANGHAAMELQGDGQLAVISSLATDPSIADQMGWFPFPAVTGGGGDPAALLGGGDGFSCTSRASTSCPDLLRYVDSVPAQTYLIEHEVVDLPANAGADDAVASTAMKLVETYVGTVSDNQESFDRALPTNAWQALDTAVAGFFDGRGSPESVATSVGPPTTP
jgi:raffinose/stachyose/melibiose transport system substrate-binding protein